MLTVSWTMAGRFSDAPSPLDRLQVSLPHWPMSWFAPSRNEAALKMQHGKSCRRVQREAFIKRGFLVSENNISSFCTDFSDRRLPGIVTG
jgi:hypothetical protein